MTKKLFLYAIAAVAALQSVAAQPRLIVQIVVSSMRGEDLDRYAENFGEGGFRRLTEGGTVYTDSRYDYLQTTTPVSLATLTTGAMPSTHGVIGSCWVDYTTNKVIELTAGRRGPGAYNLIAPTLSETLLQHAPGSREELQHVLYVAQTYFGHLLSPTEIECIMFFYDDLHFSADLLEYLVEYCVSKGSTSIHYLKKVGLAWQESGIRDVASAKQETTTFNKHYYTILKAFGIRNRAPVEKEAEMMDRWLNTYGFTIDLITEACQRTVSKIGQPSFQYAEGILSKWKEQGVRSMADVEQRDAEHQKRKKTASDQNAARKTAPAASSNRFNNFHQREYDYQKLEEQLLK